MEAFWTAIGISLKGLFGGVVGGLVSLRFFDDLTWWGRFATVISGGMIAGFGAQSTLEFLELSIRHEGFLAFVLGLFGMSMVSAVLKAVASADLWAEIKARLPGGRGKP